MKMARRWIWAGIAVAVVAATGVVIDYNITCGWASRIPWSCLAWSTLDAFKAQLIKDVPPGSSQSFAENYLQRAGITFQYYRSFDDSEEKPIVLGKALPAGWGNPFDGEAHWYIIFDRDYRVVRIEFGQQRK
jgi:hypothetical protein